MKILFTPAGDTDPVRGYHDGAMLHILRHYGADLVIVFLTADMEAKEKALHCYTKGIQSVLPDLPKDNIEFIKSGITDPQNYEKLVQIQESFAAAYQKYPDAEWLLNISSGTPQIKTVMALLALDYPDTKAIQVVSPERSSNRKNHPCTTVEELVEMLECNEDNEPGAKNRCSEPRLLLLRKQSVKNQIVSLVKNYEYGGAWQLAKQFVQLYPGFFSPVTVQLLEHGACRSNLEYETARKIISQYKETKLFGTTDLLSEYFQVMELRQRKGQLSDFVLKVSPLLVEFGKNIRRPLVLIGKRAVLLPGSMYLKYRRPNCK